MEQHDRNFNTLASGKKLGIYRVSNTSLYRIAFTSGGELPAHLQGMYTDAYQAQKAIESHLTAKQVEADKAEAKRIEDEAMRAIEASETEEEAQAVVDALANPPAPSEPLKRAAKKKTTKKKAVKKTKE